jgi:hypothetical protein
MSNQFKFGKLFFWIFLSVIPVLVWAFIMPLSGGKFFKGLDSGTSNTIMTVLFILPFLVSFIVIFKIFRKPFMSFFGGTRDMKRIMLNGRPAMAVVQQIGENSGGGVMTINDQPYLNLQLEVHDESRSPYPVSLDTIIPRAAVPQFQPGAKIPVRVDPNDPQQLVIDWNRGISPDTIAAKPTVGNVDQWTSSDNSLLDQQGIVGTAKILNIEDTGRSENYNPVVKMTYEVRSPKIDTYTFTKEVPLPTATIKMLKKAVRKSYPAKIHPHDQTKIKVDITF